MTQEEFETLVAEEFPNAIPEQFRSHINNLAFLVEDEPNAQTRKQEGLGSHETLLGLYHGVPYPIRGDLYGYGGVLPDTITLYQRPIEEEAREVYDSQQAAKEGKTWSSGPERTLLRPAGESKQFEQCVRKVVCETIWHEVAHHFGMDEHTVRSRESKRKGNP